MNCITTSNRPEANLRNIPAEPPWEREVADALEKLKIAKAGGVDAMPPELLKYGSPSLRKPLTALLQSVWTNNATPDERKTAIIVPCFKKDDTAKCFNYGGISLLVLGFEVPETVLKNRLEPACD